jgi:septal ring factor EnvC (AmiA/AmiB activator)
MSGTDSIENATLDLKEQLARIDRAQAETRKFAAEQNKLAEEASRFQAEARKLGRDYRFAPPLMLVAALGSVAAAIAASISPVKLMAGP